MRILIVADYPIPSIRKNYRADPLARYLAQFGHEVTVICPRPDSMVRPSSIPRGVRVIYAPAGYHSVKDITCLASKMGLILALKKRTEQLIERERFDLIRGISFIGGYVSCAVGRWSGLPIVVNLSDFYSDLYAQFGLPLQSLARSHIAKMEREIMHKTSALIVDTPTQRRLWRYWGLQEYKCVVLPNGVYLDRFNTNTLIDVKRTYGIDYKARIIYYHGDIGKQDGVDLLIQSSKIVKQLVREPIHFMIVGSGSSSLLRNLMRMTRVQQVKDMFTFTGWVPHSRIPDYISCADVCVAPFRLTLTSASSLSNKLIEYIAAGKPSVVSEAPGTKEMIGDVVNYVRPGDPIALATAISEVLSISDNGLIRERLQRIAVKLDWKNIVNHEEKILKTVVDGKEDDLRKLDFRIS